MSITIKTTTKTHIINQSHIVEIEIYDNMVVFITTQFRRAFGTTKVYTGHDFDWNFIEQEQLDKLKSQLL